MARDLTDRRYALDLDTRPVPMRTSKPLIREPAVWMEPGQGPLCLFLAAVIACEIGVLVWAIFWRAH